MKGLTIPYGHFYSITTNKRPDLIAIVVFADIVSERNKYAENEILGDRKKCDEWTIYPYSDARTRLCLTYYQVIHAIRKLKELGIIEVEKRSVQIEQEKPPYGYSHIKILEGVERNA